MKNIITSAAIIIIFSITAFSSVSGSDSNQAIEIHPINHATFVIQSETATIYVDPVGTPELFSPYPKPDLILITHLHRDHLSKTVIDAVKQPDTHIIATKDIVKTLADGQGLDNGERTSYKDIDIEAVPAYNLSADRLKFHPRGRDNGYVVTLSGKRIYISGDTEDIPEMRSLKNIDYAFVCMNLPYTMTVEKAAAAVLEFKPKVVMPYHYRGTNGFSDIEKFKQLVEKNGMIQVKLLPWY